MVTRGIKYWRLSCVNPWTHAVSVKQASVMLVRKNNMYNEYISLVLAKNPTLYLAEKKLTSPKKIVLKVSDSF